MPETPNPKLRPALPPHKSKPAPAPEPYAELEMVTNFSFLRGASHPDELVFRAAELGYRAVAVTDYNSLAGVVRAHEAARQAGLKLVVGARLTFVDAPDVLAWATDRAVYARLCRLLTTGKRRAEKGECELYLNDLLEASDGLMLAIVPPDDSQAAWIDPLRQLRESVGPRLSIVASCLYGPRDQRRLQSLADIGRAFGVPLLATNGVHYHDPARRALQDVITCIRHGCTIHEAGFKLFPNAERYLKSPAHMHRLFADHPQAIRRGLEIAEACQFSLDELRYEYPRELVPNGRTPIEHLEHLTWEGAAGRFPQGVPENVQRQLRHELDLIRQLQYEAYFLTVHDLVCFARGRGILCQGRGSAANSAVCYCLGVTSIDPVKSDLLFERFVSAARNEPPDIDVDFEHERREEVLQYIYDKYGRERAGMTAEVITYRGRSAVRDVGKALGLSLDLVDQMAKKLDGWSRGTISEQEVRDLGLDPQDATVRRVIALTSELLGFPRHLSQHVGGMVMTRGPLCELVPIENASMPGRTVIEWDKDDIDALGILKVDVLALGMLTCISKCLAMVNSYRSGLPPLELHTIPPEDPAVYDMICVADTVGVFQIESRAQMAMLPRLRPRCFYDLVIEVAIVRPGPIQGDMVHPYLRRRNGQEPADCPSEALQQVLGKTLGVPLFQEQAMKVAMVAAGFTADEADQLRRAMAAWRRSGAIDGFRKKIIDGMTANGYALEFAERCFQQIQGFGEYGFPESHAASFALLVYASAWLKRHHPAAFAAALLNSQPMGFYAPAQIVRDARSHGVTVLPVDVNASEWDCTLEHLRFAICDLQLEPSIANGGNSCRVRTADHFPSSSQDWVRNADPTPQRTWKSEPPIANCKSQIANALRLGFRIIGGFREDYARRISDARRRVGPFRSIPHLRRATALPRHALERLAKADAFRSLGLSRREALWQVLALSDEPAPLFDELDEAREREASLPKMPLPQEVMTDYATTGFSLRPHPMSFLRSELSKKRILSAAELQNAPAGRWVKVAGLVLIRQRPGTASGVVFVTLEDETGTTNLIVRPDIYDRYRAAARHARVLQADGYVERQGIVLHIMAKRLHDLTPLLEGYRLTSRDFH